jgi:hypothetical protein
MGRSEITTKEFRVRVCLRRANEITLFVVGLWDPEPEPAGVGTKKLIRVSNRLESTHLSLGGVMLHFGPH